LTKTGLTANTRKISDSGSLIHDTTEGYVGMPAATRDKIINNLHPEVCRVKIPFTGTCNALYHCDDSGDNCVDRTTDSTLVDSTNCVWELPYCEFSTWDEDGNPSPSSSSSSSSSSGGGGGGGAGTQGKLYVMTQSQFKEGYKKRLQVNDRFRFSLGNATHHVQMKSSTATTVTVEISSDPQLATMVEGDSRMFELTGDSFYDVKVTLHDIVVINGTEVYADVEVIETNLEVTEENQEAEKEKEDAAQKELIGEDDSMPVEPVEDEKTNLGFVILVIVIILVLGVVGFLFYKHKKK